MRRHVNFMGAVRPCEKESEREHTLSARACAFAQEPCVSNEHIHVRVAHMGQIISSCHMCQSHINMGLFMVRSKAYPSQAWR